MVVLVSSVWVALIVRCLGVLQTFPLCPDAGCRGRSCSVRTDAGHARRRWCRGGVQHAET